MKPQLIFVAALMASSVSAADLKLPDGRRFENATVVSESPRNVTIRHSGGLTAVNKDLLPSEMKQRYRVDETAARANDEAALAASKARLERVRQLESERAIQLREQRAADAAEKKTDEDKEKLDQARLTLQARSGASAELNRYFSDGFAWGNTERIVEISIADIRPATGWSDRWVVTGSAVIRQYEHSSKPVDTTGLTAKEARQAEYRAAKYTVETKRFEADYTPNSSTKLNVTLR